MSKKKKRKKGKHHERTSERGHTAQMVVDVLAQAAGDLLDDLVAYAAKRYDAYRTKRIGHRHAEASS